MGFAQYWQRQVTMAQGRMAEYGLISLVQRGFQNVHQL